MTENIGYEIPPSLKYEEKIFAGMTKRQLIYLVSAFALCAVIVKFTSFLSVYGTAYKFLLIIIFYVAATLLGNLDCALRFSCNNLFTNLNLLSRKSFLSHKLFNS